MIDGAVTRSLQSMFRELLNEDLIHDTDVGLPTINGYAYYRYDRSGMIRLLWKTRRLFERRSAAAEHFRLAGALLASEVSPDRHRLDRTQYQRAQYR